MRTMRAPIAVPEPDEEPPVMCCGFHGLRAGGNGRSKLGPPMANSCVASLPSSTPPASRSRAAATLSSFGTTFSRSFEWQVGADAGGVVDVLQRVGDAVERPTIAPRLQFSIGAARIFQGTILGHQNEGVQRTVARCNSCQRIARQRLRRDFTGAQQAAHFRDGKILRVHHFVSGVRRNTLDGSASGPYRPCSSAICSRRSA